MNNVVVIIQGGVQVNAKESIMVSVPSSGEKYREHKVNFSDTQFTVLNAGDSNYLPISWGYTSQGNVQRFSVAHTFDPAAIEIYRVQDPALSTEEIEVTVEPSAIYIDKNGAGNEFIDSSFLVRVLKTAHGEF